MFHLIGEVVKSRMAVYLIIGRIKKGRSIFRRSVDMYGFDNPDADAFVSPAVYIAGVFDCHLRVGGVQTADVFMAETLFRADKYFPEWPVFHV